MLVEQDILERSTGRAILGQLQLVRGSDAGEFPIDARKGSFLLQMESFLFASIGEDIGGRMHTGRSRIDQGATVRRLYQRNRLLNVMVFGSRSYSQFAKKWMRSLTIGPPKVPLSCWSEYGMTRFWMKTCPH